MTKTADEARNSVAAAAAQSGTTAALRALRWAAVWAVEAIAADVPADAEAPLPEGGASALRTLIGLDEALTALSAVEAAVDHMTAAALPGKAVEDYLRESLAELTRFRTRTDAARARAEELGQRESKIRGLVQQHARLREKVTELRRLQQLGEALDELAGQQSSIDARLSVLRSAAGTAEERLRDSTSELLTLTQHTRELLAEENRRLLGRLEDEHTALITAEAEHLRLTGEAAAAAARLQELAAIRTTQVDVLRAHARANESVARALPGIEAREVALAVPTQHNEAVRVGALLERVGLLLTGVDSALAEALAAADSGPAL